MEVEDGERNDEVTVWDDPCSNGVGEIEGDKVKIDDADEDNNDGNDDAASFIVFVVVVFVVTAAVVVAVVTDDEDCTCT